MPRHYIRCITPPVFLCLVYEACYAHHAFSNAYRVSSVFHHRRRAGRPAYIPLAVTSPTGSSLPHRLWRNKVNRHTRGVRGRRLDVRCECTGNPYQHQSFKPHFLFICPSVCGFADSSCLLGCPARLSLCVPVSPPPRSSISPGRGPPAPPRHAPRHHLAK